MSQDPILFGFLISFLAFLWVAFQVYLISEISSNQHDLRMARYLDICFGFLAFFSAAALMYGAFVESKTWMSAWILGSIIVLLGRWLWYLKGKFSQPSHPEIKTGFENAGLAVSVTYILLGIPILVFHRMIEYWDFSSTCSTTLECPHFLFSLLPTLGRRGSVDHSAPNNRRGCHVRSALRSAQYLPSYAQCTTNTFVAPTHTHVHIPATKDEDLYNPV